MNELIKLLWIFSGSMWGSIITIDTIVKIRKKMKEYDNWTDFFNKDKRYIHKYRHLSIPDQIKEYSKQKNINKRCELLDLIEPCYYFQFVSSFISNVEIDYALNKCGDNTYEQYEIISELKDEKLKIHYLTSIEKLDIYERDILNSIKDKNLITDYILTNMNLYDIEPTIKRCELDDDNILRILNHHNSEYFQGSEYIRVKIINLLKNDNYKVSFINEYTGDSSQERNNQISILSSFTDINLRNELANRFNINEREILVEKIRTSESPEEKDKLIIETGEKDLIMDVESNNMDNYQKIIDNIETPTNYPLIDQNITFGVELEASNEKFQLFRAIGKILNNWKIKSDGSIKNSTEITSPILHFNEHDLKELKFICNFMEKNNFTESDDCGGHIHIGIDYLKDSNALKMLYYIFSNCEYIFYLITNRDMTIPRTGVTNYSKSISPIINRYQEIFNNCITYDELVLKLQSMQEGRYYSLNISNAGSADKNTIEFRLPNGEINFNELLYNIILITKLVEKAKYFSTLNNNKEIFDKLDKLSDNINNNDKVKILLDLLFDDDKYKQVYYQRFVDNSRLLRKYGKTRLQNIGFATVKLDKVKEKNA